MRFSIDDTINPADTRTNLNLIQSLNTMAFVLRKITGQASWKMSPSLSLSDLRVGTKGDPGDTGAQGIQGLKGDKGDKGDKGEPAPLNHTHVLSDVSLLQTELNAKATIDHNHLPEAWQNIPLSSSWSNLGTGFATPQCRKLVGNLIEVKGTIRKATAVISNETIATLPSGYRPSDTRYFITWSSNGYSRLQVEPNGEIKLSISGSNPNAALNFVFGLN